MWVKLKVLKGSKTGKLLPIQGNKMLIGRGEGCDLRPRTDIISRQHCLITVTDSQVLVKDLGSKNGTYVNGNRINAEQGLQANDHVKVGPLEFEVLIEQGNAKRPKVENMSDVVQRTVENSASGFDISSWLEEVDEEERDERLRDPETRQFKLEEKSGENSKADATVDQESEESSSDASTTAKKIQGKKEFGKLPDSAKGQKHKSSREAAQDTLKRLFTKG